MTPDNELLRCYAETKSEDAFAELVRRHLNLVYSAALRQVNGDAHLAQDVAQTVFADLARKAAVLARRATITGWLYTSAHFAAAKTVRTEQRRHAREQEAHTMRELLHDSTPDADWEKLRPMLDDAMHELNEADREAILLRYFENQQLAAIGAKFGLGDDAARKRVDRALDKLRSSLIKRGLSTTAVALSTALAANAVQLAPAGLAATLTSASLAAATAGTTTTLTLLKIMAMTKMQIGVTALIITGAAISLIVQHQSQDHLRVENESLRQQIARLQTENENLSQHSAGIGHLPAPRLPAPSLPTAASTAAPVENPLVRVAEKPLLVTSEQAEQFLAENHTNASSLLAAFRTTGNTAYLDEAMRKFPDDPQVAFEAALRKDVSAEEKRRWVDVLKKSDPDNPFANYLSALGYFNSGQTDLAVEELIAASGKSRFNDYYANRLEANEEAYRSAGYSEVETRVAASMGPGGLDQPQLQGLKDLCVKMVDLAKSYRQTGDETSAQAALQMAVNLGEYFDGSKGIANRPPITRISALVIEEFALRAMDPGSPFGSDGGTVKDRLDYIAGKKTAAINLCNELDALYPKATPQDMINFLDRAVFFGDDQAMAWLRQKYGEK